MKGFVAFIFFVVPGNIFNLQFSIVSSMTPPVATYCWPELKKPIVWEDGSIIPPTEPGLGVECNEEVAASHPDTEDKLHLEMHPEPIRDIAE